MDIFVIHGGTTFETYESYLEYLTTKEINRDKLNRVDWKTTLGEKLGNGFEVFVPKMPNGQNAKYLEWKIWFERLIPLMHEPVVLIGHSLGGIFLAKYLSEELIPKKIRATFLVAAPFNTQAEPFRSTHGSTLGDFVLSNDLKRLIQQAGDIFLFQSPDDEVVTLSNLEKYRQVLPLAYIRIIERRGHFTQKNFPELEEEIKRLS